MTQEPKTKGLTLAINNLVNKATLKRYPNGEPDPKLFSEGYRQALIDYSQYNKRKSLRKLIPTKN